MNKPHFKSYSHLIEVIVSITIGLRIPHPVKGPHIAGSRGLGAQVTDSALTRERRSFLKGICQGGANASVDNGRILGRQTDLLVPGQIDKISWTAWGSLFSLECNLSQEQICCMIEDAWNVIGLLRLQFMLTTEEVVAGDL